MSVTVLLITHGDAGTALIGSSEMILGHEHDLLALPLNPGTSFEELFAQAASIIEAAGNPTLILVDVYGGTPANVAMALSKSPGVRCVSGLNLGMLLEVLSMRDSVEVPSLHNLQRIAQSAGIAACRAFAYEDTERR